MHIYEQVTCQNRCWYNIKTGRIAIPSEMHPLREAKIAKAGQNGGELTPHGARAASLLTRGPHSWGVARSISQGCLQSQDLGSIRFHPAALNHPLVNQERKPTSSLAHETRHRITADLDATAIIP